MLAYYYQKKKEDYKSQEYYLRKGVKNGYINLLINLDLFYSSDEYYPIPDLKKDDRKRLTLCVRDLYSRREKGVDTPIPNLDELCPRKLPSPVE